MYKILGLDIDGTLLNTKKELTKAVKDSVNMLQERKIPVVIASGRPQKGIRHVEKELQMKEKGGYVLSFNGGKITDCVTGEEIYSKTVPQEYYKEVYEYAKSLDCSMLTYEGEYIITEKPDNKYVDVESRVVKMEVKKVDNLLDRLNFPVDKFLLVGEPDYMMSQVNKMAEHFKGRLNVFQSEPFFIEVVPLGIDKAASFGILLDKLKLKREELIVCGDGRNDITMIKYAGLGVAMENACDEAKKVADYIAPSCDNDGVAYVINKYFNV